MSILELNVAQKHRLANFESLKLRNVESGAAVSIFEGCPSEVLYA